MGDGNEEIRIETVDCLEELVDGDTNVHAKAKEKMAARKMAPTVYMYR